MGKICIQKYTTHGMQEKNNESYLLTTNNFFTFQYLLALDIFSHVYAKQYLQTSQNRGHDYSCPI